MTLTLGISPCPNDTFVFDALIHKKIDTEGLDFEVTFADVEDLNQRAFRNELQITKLSYHAYLHLERSYALLRSGGAMGFGCGPLLISKKSIDIHSVSEERIGIPGKFTTANLLLQFYLKKKLTPREFLFSEIESELLNEHIEAGVIIHESRFTYQAKGLQKIADLGEFWETQTGSPIPLGAIVIQNKLGLDLKEKIERLITRSITFAFENPNSSRLFVKDHSQDMDDRVIANHIALYVNSFSVDIGDQGEKAIQNLRKNALEVGLI